MKDQDEYIWENYPEEYAGQLKEMREKEGFDFFVKNFTAKREITFQDKLHDNWRELYSVIYELEPRSVFECGVGACYHLKNISTILPNAILGGTDLLERQIEFGKEFSRLPPFLQNCVFQSDMTDENYDLVPYKSWELVFSHAVVMHLSTEKAIRFLGNMAKISKKYILLIEGVNNHENWFDLVQQTLPDWDFKLTSKYIDNAILLTRKAEAQ